MPEGPFIVDDPHVALPPKEACYNQMEAMIYHFKLIMDGIQVPAGERYGMVEGGNGELGFYVHQRRHRQALPHQGAGRPASRSSPPSPQLINGGSLSDAIVSLGGLNVIAGRARAMSQPIAHRAPIRAALKLPGVQDHPKATEPRPMSLAERLYLPLLGGMMVTIRHCPAQPASAAASGTPSSTRRSGATTATASAATTS